MERAETSEGLEGLEFEGPTSTAAMTNASTDVAPDWPNITYHPYYQHSLPVAASFILSYFAIFLLCMVGNILVCFIVVENRRMRTVINLFILNLAISDLLVGIFCIPTTLVDNLITGWPFSNSVCKMSGFVQGVSVSASVFTLVAIAIERFRCIMYPLHRKPTIFVAQAAILLIWVLAVAIMCPAALALTVERIPNNYMVHGGDLNHTLPLYSCFENFANPQMRKVYTVVLFVHIYLAPLAIITIMYVSIGVKLCSSVLVNREPPTANGAVEVRERQGRQLMVSRKKLMVIKMLILVTLLFMLSWLPLWTLMMMTDYAGLDSEQVDLLTSYIFPFAHWLAFANSSINPIIYGYYNENFKRGFQAVCRSRPLCWLLRCRHGERMAGRAGNPRPVEDPQGAEPAGAHNHIVLRVRNRVHNVARLTDAEEARRHSAAEAAMAIRPQRDHFDQTVETAVARNKDHHGHDSNRVSSLRVSVYKAWEK